MTCSIAVLIPVLDRPQRVAPLVKNLHECSFAIDCIPVFIAGTDDEAERAEIERVKAWLITPPRKGGLPGDYAFKINFAFNVVTRQDVIDDIRFCFLGADDLYFHPGWAERAVAAWAETGACVIGTNDLANPLVQRGGHATHSLVHRDYIDCGTIDEPDVRKVLHEGYDHNFVDNEFIETAKMRRTYWHAHDVQVEHMHPIWKTAPMDDTYARGMSKHSADQALYQQRKKLWA